jgi:hypothetical protein
LPAGPPATKALERISNGNGYYRPTSPEDSERMFVCATLSALIKAGSSCCRTSEASLGGIVPAVTRDRAGHWEADTMPKIEIEFAGTECFVVFNGTRIAKRGKNRTWISLEPGFVVVSGDDDRIVIEHNGVRVH